jgi:hypothetical protein
MGTQKTYRHTRTGTKRRLPKANQNGTAIFLVVLAAILLGGGFLYLCVGDKHAPKSADFAATTSNSEPNSRTTSQVAREQASAADAPIPPNTQPIPYDTEPSSAAAPPPSPSSQQEEPELSPWVASSDSHQDHKLSSNSYQTYRGSFSVSSHMKSLPSIKCDYVIPIHNGSPLPSAVDIVAIFPFPTEGDGTKGPAKILAENYGFTVLALEFPGFEKDPGADHNNFYYYPASGSAEAYTTALSKLRDLCKFPHRKIFAFGLSGGGSMAQLFAEAYPEEVIAVAQEAARIYPIPNRFLGPMLILYGEDDYVAPMVSDFSKKLQNKNAQALIVPFRPNWEMRGKSYLWTHGMYDRPRDIMWKWISDIGNLAANTTAEINPNTWRINDGTRFPGEESYKAWRHMPPPTVREKTNSTNVTVSEPGRDAQSRALVIFLSSAAYDRQEEVRFDAIHIADRGYTSVCITGPEADQADAISHSIDRLSSETRRLPVFLIVYDAPIIRDDVIRSLNSVKLNEVLFCNDFKYQITKAQNLLGSSHALAILASSMEVPDSKIDPSIFASFHVPATKDFYEQHVNRETTVSQLIEKFLASEKHD